MAVIKKLKKRYQKWKIWCRYSTFTKFEKILILLGLKKSLYFERFKVNE